MTQYNVTGMSCAACVARVEKAVSKIDGVNSCSVSLLTNSMNVDGSADSSAIINAVQNAGYGASLKGKEKNRPMQRILSKIPKHLNQKKTYRIAHCPCSVDVFFNGTYDVGMAVAVIFDNNHIAMGLVQLILSGIVMVINQKFLSAASRGLSALLPIWTRLLHLVRAQPLFTAQLRCL